MTTMAWGEDIQIFMELGFPVNPFTLDDAVLGVLDDDFLDGTLIGDDVSPYAQEVSISRGRSDQLQNFNAGTCSVRLLNRDRRFDPINESSPYWNSVEGKSGVAPRRKVTVFSDGVALFTGRITDIDVSYEPNNPNATTENSYVTITAADDFVLLANTFTESAITPSQELSGTRVTTILDLPEVGYPATRDIDTGAATLGGGATFDIDANTNVLTYLQSVATSEQGYFFVAANGDLTFTDRISASFASPVATFSDAGTDIPYTSLSVMYGQEFLYNKVVCSVEGGTDQVANDVVSQTEYGISTLNLSGLLLVDDAAAITLATDLLGRYKEPEYRFDKLRTIYNSLGSGDQGTLTGVEIADVVEITRSYPTGTPATVTKEYSIENIRHVITSNAHTVEFGLAVADLVDPFILAGLPIATTRTNLVANPNFEVNTTSWAAISTSGLATLARITTDDYIGTASLQVTKGTGRTETYEETLIGSVVAGNSYTISGYMKVPTGNETMTAGCRALFLDASGGLVGTFISGSTSSLTDTSGWVRFSVTATAPATSSYVRAYFGQTLGGTAGQVFLVDAVLVEETASLLPYFDGTYVADYTGYGLYSKAWNGTANASTSTASWFVGNTRTNLVTNPNFEVNLSTWATSGTVARTTAQFYSGVASASLTYAGSGTVLIEQSTRSSVTAGLTYTASFFLKQSVDAGSVVCNFMWYNAAGSVILDDLHQSNNPNTAWQRFSQTRTAPANAASCSFRIYQTAGEGGGAVATLNYVDAVLVEQASSALPYFDGTYVNDYTGYGLYSKAWNGTANDSTSTASWYLGNTRTNLVVNPNFEPSTATRDNHAYSEWYCFVTVASCTYACAEPSTTIYQKDSSGVVSTVLTTGSSPQRGTIAITAGYFYYADKPLNLVPVDNHHAIVPLSVRGNLFGLYRSRNVPTTLYFYSPYDDVVIKFYDNVTGGVTGTPTSTVSLSAGASTTVSNSNVPNLLIVIDGGEVVATATQTGVDKTILYPMSDVIYNRRLGFGITETNTTPTGSFTYVTYDSFFGRKVQTTEIADGSGGDASQGIALDNLGNRYVLGFALSDYTVSAPYGTTTITSSYWNGSSWVVWDTHNIVGSQYNPNGTSRDGTNGPGVEASNISGTAANMAGGVELWKFEGDKPFFLGCNDAADDEMTVLGWCTDDCARLWINSAHSFSSTSSDSYFGSRSGLMTTLSSANYPVVSSRLVPITPSTSYFLSGYIKNVSGSTRTPYIAIQYFQSDGTTYISEFNSFSQGSLAIADGWVLRYATSTAPANAYYAKLNLIGGSTGLSAGWETAFDGILFEQSSSVLPYFDGTYADTYTGYTLTEQGWNGTADASASTATWVLDSSYVAGTPMDSDYALS